MYPQSGNPLHEHRWLLVDALAANQQILSDYPHRYVFLAVKNPGHEMTSAPGQLVVAQLFWGVEMMESEGWEPVAWDLEGATVGVVMRRTANVGY